MARALAFESAGGRMPQQPSLSWALWLLVRVNLRSRVAKPARVLYRRLRQQLLCLKGTSNNSVKLWRPFLVREKQQNS